MKFNSLIPELTVSDLKETKHFYIDVLGFKVIYERPEDLFVFLQLEENQIMFEQNQDNWKTGELEYPLGRGVNFEMTVSDVDRLYVSAMGAGIRPFRKLKVSEYRSGDQTIVQKEFLIQDPDGYLLKLQIRNDIIY